MNKVDLFIAKEPARVKLGDIWRSVYGDLYLVARCDRELYVAVSLQDGNRWNGMSKSIEAVVEGLEFVANNVRITIEEEGA